MGELSKMRAWLLLVALALALASAEDGVKVMEAHEVGAHSDVGEAVQPTADKGPIPKGDPTPKKVEVPATAKANTLQDRRKKRLKNEAYGLNKKYEYAKALKGKADRNLRHVMAKMSKADTAIEEAKAARLAAKKEQREWKHKEDDAHMAMINSRDELAAVKKQDKKAAAYVDEAKVSRGSLRPTAVLRAGAARTLNVLRGDVTNLTRRRRRLKLSSWPASLRTVRSRRRCRPQELMWTKRSWPLKPRAIPSTRLTTDMQLLYSTSM